MSDIKRAAEHHEVMRQITPKPKPKKRAKKQNNPPIDKEAILAGRKGRMCDCGCGKPGHDLHHCFIGRRKGYPILDDERNIVLVNHDEHIARKFDNLEWRRKFWRVQFFRYGKEKMYDWIIALPAKFEYRIDWL
jgi:hypothetical protein